METFKNYIMELFLHGEYHKGGDNYLIANYENIWILNSEMDIDECVELLTEINDELESDINLDRIIQTEDETYRIIVEFLEKLKQHKPEIVVGFIVKQKLPSKESLFIELYIEDSLYVSDPKSSVIIDKIVRQLKIDKVHITKTDYDTGEEEKITHNSSEIKRQIPDIAYHGTSSFNIRKILKIGIRPNKVVTNYYGIQHHDLVFFGTLFIKAIGYALGAIKEERSYRGIIEYPVIIEFKIPNKNLIIADYDIERFSGVDKHYHNIKKDIIQHNRHYRYRRDPDKLSQEHGIYGYKGVINPGAFLKIYMPDRYIEDAKYREDGYKINDFIEYTPKEFLIRLEEENL